MCFLRSVLCVVGLSAVIVHADSGADRIKSVYTRPLYAQPIATIIGTGTTSGWYQSARVDNEFGWGVALPISLIFLNKNDRQYSGTYTAEECVECGDYIAPTFFGTIAPPVLLSGGQIDPPFITGSPDVPKYTMVPFVTLQTMFSMYHTALTLRYIGIPEIGGFSFGFPGFGLQHDISHFLPPIPVSIAVAGNLTFLSANWKVSDVENVEGSLTLKGLSQFYGILAGTQLGYIEAFLELGWEHSYLKPGGDIYVYGEPQVATGAIPGRNGFRAALNVALPIEFNPVVGASGGAQFATLINVISFKSKRK